MLFWTSHRKRQYSDILPHQSWGRNRNAFLMLFLFTDIHSPMTPEETLKGRSGQLSVFEEAPAHLGKILSSSPEGPGDMEVAGLLV